MSEPNFHVGDIVHHKLYGYRGVIAGFDPTCQASDEWYDFQTQGSENPPTKDQCWYHVLVDGATHTTYVAEQNLEHAAVTEPVQHPLVKEVFQTYFGGHYYRENLN